jgi:hypothetical protein
VEMWTSSSFFFPAGWVTCRRRRITPRIRFWREFAQWPETKEWPPPCVSSFVWTLFWWLFMRTTCCLSFYGCLNILYYKSSYMSTFHVFPTAALL